MPYKFKSQSRKSWLLANPPIVDWCWLWCLVWLSRWMSSSYSSSSSPSWFFLLPKKNPWTSRSQSSLLPPPFQLWNTSPSLSWSTVFVSHRFYFWSITSSSCSTRLLRIEETFYRERAAQEPRQRHFQSTPCLENWFPQEVLFCVRLTIPSLLPEMISFSRLETWSLMSKDTMQDSWKCGQTET